jgi:2',3'-cyclic-nucleotide 2'-phosphodiesterase (5'-nucleotidase family)
MMSKKIAIFVVIALLLISGCSPAASKQTSLAASLEGQLIILHTNDIHGRVLEDPSSGAIGFSAIAAYKKELLAKGASVLLLDAGDVSQGTPIVNLSYGKSAIEIMNLVGYDGATPGNHEFDWGSDNLLQNVQVANFPFLSANIVNRTGRDNVFEPSKVFEMPNGMKVGVFGLTTPETLTKTHPDKVKDVDFFQGEELYAAAQAEIDKLKSAGCTMIIALGHLGVDEESAPNRSRDVIEKTTGIDLFIDGHSHTTFDSGEKVGETLLVSTGEYCKYLGVVSYDGTNLEARLYNGRDTDVETLVNSINDEVQEQLGKVFAKTEVDLNGERDPGVRTMETNLGDFVADAILWSAKQSVGDDVVAAITNGGGIRASIKTGDITMNDMKTVFPFGNKVSVLTVTGKELLEALEAATSTTPVAIAAFPQVSGFEFSISSSVAFVNGEQYPESTYFAPQDPGNRVTITTVGGQPFSLEAQYKVATNDFVAAGGDTYYAFKYANQQTGYNTEISLEDALIQYVGTELSGVIGQDYLNPKGRITIN